MTPGRAGFLEWLLKRHAIALARANDLGAGHRRAELLRRGAVAVEVADRTLDPVDPFRSGPAPFLAIDHYRVATYFHLAAAVDGADAPDLRRAWDACPEELLLFAAAGPEGRVRMERILFGSSVAEDAELPVDEQRRRAEEARAFVRALARRLESAERTVARLRVQRNLHVALMLAVLAGIGMAGAGLTRRLTRRPDLAAGKHFEVSSTMSGFDPSTHTVGDAPVALLFHTEEQENPWVEFDLGEPTLIGSIEVSNRSDCCPERAIPLVVEVSIDQHEYVEVARRSDVFNTWRPTFAPREARWVRLSVPRRTWFHLDGVSVYAP